MTTDLKTLIENKMKFDDSLFEKHSDFYKGAKWQHAQMMNEVLPILLECVESLHNITKEQTIPEFEYHVDQARRFVERLRKWSACEKDL